jgi:hypothetical protein
MTIWDTLDEAIGDFAGEYTDQNKTNHTELIVVVKAGKIKAADRRRNLVDFVTKQPEFLISSLNMESSP